MKRKPDQNSRFGERLRGLRNERGLSMEQLCEVLRSRSYILRCAGPAAERDGMTDFPASEL